MVISKEDREEIKAYSDGTHPDLKKKKPYRSRNSHFSRNGLIGPTYYCKLCKKRTRETGHDESSCELCKSCYFECLKENEEMNK